MDFFYVIAGIIFIVAAAWLCSLGDEDVEEDFEWTQL